MKISNPNGIVHVINRCLKYNVTGLPWISLIDVRLLFIAFDCKYHLSVPFNDQHFLQYVNTTYYNYVLYIYIYF